MNNIGERLNQARLAQNLSIEQVSAKTKIRPHILEAIEAGRHDVLPEVYIKSFIKTYSNFLKITEEHPPGEEQKFKAIPIIIDEQKEPEKQQMQEIPAVNKPYQKKQESRATTISFASSLPSCS